MMAIRETIAIIGATEKTGIAVANKLAEINGHLLLIPDSSNALIYLYNQIRDDFPDAEIEIMECAREGCWQADIIIFAIPFYKAKEIIKTIQEVATQKIVLSIADMEDDASLPFIEAQELQRLLPYSKVVAACTNPYAQETFIAGDDAEAVKTISQIIKTAGYQPKAAESLSAIKAL